MGGLLRVVEGSGARGGWGGLVGVGGRGRGLHDVDAVLGLFVGEANALSHGVVYRIPIIGSKGFGEVTGILDCLLVPVRLDLFQGLVDLLFGA